MMIYMIPGDFGVPDFRNRIQLGYSIKLKTLRFFDEAL